MAGFFGMLQNPGNGLLGLGGIGGMSPQLPAGILANDLYDPEAMRRLQIKNAMLGAGIALLGGGDRASTSFADQIGQGLKGGLLGAKEAGDQYTENAILGTRMQRENQTYQRQQDEYARETDQRQAREAWLKSQPANVQQMLRANPELIDDYVKATNSQFQTAGGNDAYFGTPLPMTDGNGNFVGYGLPSKAGGFKPLDPGAGNKFLSPYDKSFQTKAGSEAGKAQGEAAGDLPGALVQAETTKMKIDDLLANPDLDKAIGYSSYVPDMLTSNAVIDIRGKIKELQGGAFLEARQLLKGGGQITDFEGQKAEAAYTRMQTAIRSSDVAAFKAALQDFRNAVDVGVQKLRATAGQPAIGAGGTTSTGVPWSVE